MGRKKGSRNKPKLEKKVEEEVIKADDKDCCDSEQKLEEPIAA